MLTFGSLFAGIGGIDLGLERAGLTCEWQVEIDDFCQSVLTKHWPAVEKFRDVKECGKHNLRSVDIICGGFPCQDISLAGKRKGLEGERSGLWREFARIICELRPQWVVVENVPGLLSIDDGRGMGAVLGDLAESGYGAAWDCIPASTFGAPHLRYRTFIVAYLNQGRLQRQNGQHFNNQGESSNQGWGRVFQHSPRGNSKAQSMAYIERSGLERSRAEHRLRENQVKGENRWSSWWSVEPDVGRVVHGFSGRMDRRRHKQRISALGNAVVPQIAEYIGQLIVEAEKPAR